MVTIVYENPKPDFLVFKAPRYRVPSPRECGRALFAFLSWSSTQGGEFGGGVPKMRKYLMSDPGHTPRLVVFSVGSERF